MLVLCSVAGVQSQSITVNRQMHRYKVPRIAFVNKCDRAGANPLKVADQLKEKLGLAAVALQLEHVFSRERPRGRKVQGNSAVDDFAGLVPEIRQDRVAGRRQRAGDDLCNSRNIRSGHTDYSQSARPGGCRYRADRVGAFLHLAPA